MILRPFKEIWLMFIRCFDLHLWGDTLELLSTVIFTMTVSVRIPSDEKNDHQEWWKEFDLVSLKLT